MFQGRYFFKKLDEIATEVSKEVLVRSFAGLPNDAAISQSGDYRVYLIAPEHAAESAILREIGRLREITFRAIGEGTGKDVDLDEYDDYFHQLVLWDTNNKMIVGAYRLGMGPEIYKAKRAKGFYIRSLFKIKSKGEYLLAEGLEMGRAFIREEYQMRPTPLFLMWKSILKIVLQRDDLKYIFGCISISNAFSQTSRSLITAYIKKYYFDAEYSQYVKPKIEYKADLNPVAHRVLESAMPNDVKGLEKIVRKFEPSGVRFPVLVKKYLSQNARVVGFNRDPKFGNSLDGFMYINVNHLPEKTLKLVIDELDQAL
mgnify:CR=1 FL=1